MKKIKYLLCIFIFFFSLNVKAIDECSANEMKKLRDLANKIEVKIDYEISDNIIEKDNSSNEPDDDGIEDNYILPYVVKYKLQFINMDDNLKVQYKYDFEDDEDYELINFSELQTKTFFEGKYIFQIYSYTADYCTNNLLRTLNIELPTYNSYYYNNKDKCRKYPEFKYCKEFMDVDINEYENIDKQFEEYIKGENKETKDDTNVFNIWNTYKYYIIGTGLALIFVVIIIVIIKKKKKEEV